MSFGFGSASGVLADMPVFRAPRTVAPRIVSAPQAPAAWGAPTVGGKDTSARGNPFAELMNNAARRHGVDPTLVAAVTRAESGFNPLAVSSAGAKGLMQLMDGTAEILGVDDPFDPAQNVDGGTRFLAEMLRRFKQPELALAAYNAGPGAVTKFGGVPPYRETQTYVSRVLEYQRQMRMV